jgi:hypothetical protein
MDTRGSTNLKLGKNRPWATQDKPYSAKLSPEAKPNRAYHRSNRCGAPVMSGQLGMNSTRGSTLKIKSTDLPIRSTDSRETLGKVGTPHG